MNITTDHDKGQGTRDCPSFTQGEPQSELEQVLGMLNAYRQGWISYDTAHVRELQKRRLELQEVA